MNLRKRFLLFSIVLLLFPLGINALLLRILYYRTKMGFVGVDPVGNHRSFMHILFENYQILLVILAVIALVGMIITGISFMRGLLRPLKQLTIAAAEIERGNLDFSLTYNVYDEYLPVFTQFDRMRVRLKDSLWQQVEDEKTRTELLANIAHDLRTPITSIQGYAQGLLDGVARTEDKKEKYLQTIIVKSEEIARMSESLSAFTQLGREKLSLQTASVKAHAFIEAEYSDIALSYDTIDLTKNFCLDDETTICIDPLQIKRVITNIVQNCMKYNTDGKAKLSFTASENENYVVFSFADQGIGVSEHDLKRIFDRFYRSDRARQNTNNGSGLGLSISKQIIHSHQGQIWARQNNPTGLIICFSIPISKYGESHENLDY